MFGFKKKYEKKVAHNNMFLKDCAIQIQGLIDIYGSENETVKNALSQLAEDLTFTIPTSDPKAKAKEKEIGKAYDQLSAMMKQPDWVEAEVLAIIKGMRISLTEINAMRS